MIGRQPSFSLLEWEITIRKEGRVQSPGSRLQIDGFTWTSDFVNVVADDNNGNIHEYILHKVSFTYIFPYSVNWEDSEAIPQ